MSTLVYRLCLENTQGTHNKRYLFLVSESDGRYQVETEYGPIGKSTRAGKHGGWYDSAALAIRAAKAMARDRCTKKGYLFSSEKDYRMLWSKPSKKRPRYGSSLRIAGVDPDLDLSW